MSRRPEDQVHAAALLPLLARQRIAEMPTEAPDGDKLVEWLRWLNQHEPDERKAAVSRPPWKTYRMRLLDVPGEPIVHRLARIVALDKGSMDGGPIEIRAMCYVEEPFPHYVMCVPLDALEEVA
jgi:hypothetical protein